MLPRHLAETDHGNDVVRKAWKATTTASHPSPKLNLPLRVSPTVLPGFAGHSLSALVDTGASRLPADVVVRICLGHSGCTGIGEPTKERE